MKVNRFCTALLTATIAGTILTAPCNPFNATHANAASVPSTTRIKDLNEDGVLDLFDAMHLMGFLEGQFDYAYAYTDMDATSDCIVDQADAQAYLAYYNYYRITLGTTAPFSSRGSTHATTTSNVSYNAYDAQTTTFLESYTLNALPTNNATRAIIGIDNREPDWSNSSVVRLKMFDSEGYYTSTGFVIDTHTIVTGAHCVFDEDAGECLRAGEIQLFDSNGNSTLQATAVEIHVPQAYIVANPPNSNYSPTSDYAVITVEEDLSNYVNMEVGLPLDGIAGLSHTATVTGFPQSNPETKTSSTGTVYQTFATRIDHTCDTLPGMSGGPIYCSNSDVHGMNGTMYSVIGINVAEVNTSNPLYNVGTRITLDILHFFFSNPKLDN